MLIDRRATGHLVWGYYPFVPPGEEVVGKFSPVSPPGIAVHTEADQATFGVAAERVVGYGDLFHDIGVFAKNFSKSSSDVLGGSCFALKLSLSRVLFI